MEVTASLFKFVQGGVTQGVWLAILSGLFLNADAREGAFVPLPRDVVNPEAPSTDNPLIDLATRTIQYTETPLAPAIPDKFSVDSEGSIITYDPEHQIMIYDGQDAPLRLQTDEGLEISASKIEVKLDTGTAELIGPLVIYQDDSLTRAQSGSYNWQSGVTSVQDIRSKVNGIILRGAGVEYRTDEQGRNFMLFRDTYVTTEDAAQPLTWIGVGEMKVYPGDYGSISRLSVATPHTNMAVPILGWMTLSHSLNPREGYLPAPGSKSIWGTYLLNQYGILLGNRHVEGGMPVADYVMTTHADYRTRRGVAFGLDLEDIALRKKYPNIQGLKTYLALDSDPTISPVNTPRPEIDHQRYQIKLQTLNEATLPGDLNGTWSLVSNLDILSDRYMLQDFFEEECRTDDKPDNTIRLERLTKRDQTMLYTRLAPNNFYQTEQRTEASYYRVRSPLGNLPLAYETRNSFGVMRQYVPALEKLNYRAELAATSNKELMHYYERMLNTESYLRFNTTHEFSTSFKLARFLNVTPKTGFGYTGYYDVGGIGSDNRYLGYIGCDFDLKFHRNFNRFSLPSLGMKGLTHVIHPYASFSHTNISSSNPLVPKIDTWSSKFGTSTVDPMPLDLMGLTGIDAWGQWTIWRLGVQNVVTTSIDGELLSLLSWNVSLDYNVDNPNTESQYSNMYSALSIKTSERFRISIESQTPTIQNGDGFSQYNTDISYQPFAWLEGHLGHRYIHGHPILDDSSQLYIQGNLRINENYTFAGRWYYDERKKRFPIQQYSLFRNAGPWFIGATYFIRNNDGKKEHGFGLSFTLGETGTALPVNFF